MMVKLQRVCAGRLRSWLRAGKLPAIAAAMAFFLLGEGAPAQAQAARYPQRPIRILVSSPAGGTVDLIARVVAQRLSQILGVGVIVDNRAGAAGSISVDITLQADPDGYTLLMIGPPIAINVTLRGEKGMKYDPLKDFSHIALTGKVPLVITVLPSFPAGSLREFIYRAKTGNAPLTYGSAGTGSSNHLVGESLKAAAGINMTHVPFKGGANALSALLSRELDVYIATVPTVLPMVKSSRVRAIAVSTATRSVVLPDVPTIADTLPGFDLSSWFVVLGPAGISKAIVERLNTEISRVLDESEVRNRLVAGGVNVETMTPPQVGAFIRDEVEKLGKAVKISGARVDS